MPPRTRDRLHAITTDDRPIDPGDLARIAPNLRALAVPIDRILPHPRNPNTGDVDAIAESIDTFQQYAPIVVQRATGYIAKGNHTYLAMRQINAPAIAVNYMDWDDATTLAVLVGDNRHSEKSQRDQDALADLLRELDAQERLLGTGYTRTDVQAIIDQLGAVEHVEFDAFGDPTPGDLRYRVVVDDLDRDAADRVNDEMAKLEIPARVEQYRA